MKKTIYLLGLALLYFSCTHKNNIEPNLTNNLQTPVVCNTPLLVSYKLHVKPIINQHCVACHNNNTAIPLDIYETVSPYCIDEKLSTYIKEDPYHNNIEYSTLDVCEQKMIYAWIKQGFKNN
jgi:hypothetical protein